MNKLFNINYFHTKEKSHYRTTYLQYLTVPSSQAPRFPISQLTIASVFYYYKNLMSFHFFFKGDSDDTYDGLYIIDGSIIPCVLGVNPAFTITCIAERCMRLLAQDEKWTVDYSLQQVSFLGKFDFME